MQNGNRILEHEIKLTERYGPIIGGKNLRKLLGYDTSEAFRMAKHRNKLPIRTFSQEDRRGAFARAKDIAKWLAKIDAALEGENPKEVRTD